MYADEDTIWMACVRAVLPFLPEYGWTDRLGQCEISDCGKWFLRKNISGPPRKYCGDEHATVARSRRYRGKRA
jgi:hypothetical protein